MKDRRIGFIRLDGKVRGCCIEKRLQSVDKKSQNYLETDGRVDGNCWSWILFRKLFKRLRIDNMQC